MSHWNFLKPRKTAPAEKDVARECERIKLVEDVSKRLLKEGRKLSDASVASGKAAAKVGADFSSLNSETGKVNCAAVLESTMDECERLSQDKHHLIQKTLVEPMKRYNATFPQLNTHIKGHEKAQQEYKKMQAKVDKLKEKEETGPNMVKMNNLRKELTPVKDDFHSKHNMLLDEFPAFFNNRLQYLQPIFEALVRSECWYHHEIRELFEKTLFEVTENEPDSDLEADVQDALEQIRGLSITKD